MNPTNGAGLIMFFERTNRNRRFKVKTTLLTRNGHLDFAKTGTNRQAELAALVHRIFIHIR
jgi:hypothetical protein